MASFWRRAPRILPNLNHQQQVRLVELTGRIPILLRVLMEVYHDMMKNERSEASEVGREAMVENLVSAVMESEVVTLMKEQISAYAHEQISTLRQKDINALKQYVFHILLKSDLILTDSFRFEDGWSNCIFEYPMETRRYFTSTNQGMGAQNAELHAPMPRDVYSSFRQYRNM